jgi:hypothetical protein
LRFLETLAILKLGTLSVPESSVAARAVAVELLVPFHQVALAAVCHDEACAQYFSPAVACPLPPGADKVDCAEGMATLEAMSSHHNFRPGQQNKLVSEPPIAAPDEHAQLVEADQRFQAALGQAIAAGGERIEAVEATVQLKRRTKLPR